MLGKISKQAVCHLPPRSGQAMRGYESKSTQFGMINIRREADAGRWKEVGWAPNPDSEGQGRLPEGGAT